MTTIEATELEQQLLDEATDCGWVFSLEQLRESRRRGPKGLLVAQRLLEAAAADSLSAAEELALVEECWRAGGVWLLEELAKDRLRASRALVDVWEEANEPAGEVTAGPARLVRVAFSQEVGGESFFHGSMRFKPGEGFTRAADDVLRPESLRGGALS